MRVGGLMGTRVRPFDPDQLLMLPPDLRERVPEGHLAHYMSDLVDAVDLSAFYAPYLGDGRRNSPCDLRMMREEARLEEEIRASCCRLSIRQRRCAGRRRSKCWRMRATAASAI